MGGLPHLPAPGQAERLPINRQRLAQRIRLLRPDQQEQLRQVADLLVWERLASFETDAEVMQRYHEVLAGIRDDALRQFVHHWMAIRTVLAALRRRAAGRPAPTRGETWGIDPRARWIEGHWDQPDFGLAAACPWIVEAREHLAAERAVELDALQTRLVWRYLDRLAEPDPFGFAAVFAYAFKWHLLNRRLAQDPVRATERFRDLVKGACDELQQNVA